jgi:hypothetical protein
VATTIAGYPSGGSQKLGGKGLPDYPIRKRLFSGSLLGKSTLFSERLPGNSGLFSGRGESGEDEGGLSMGLGVTIERKKRGATQRREGRRPV